jgi:hypothetical protein
MKIISFLLCFTLFFADASTAQIKAECLSGNCVNGKGKYKYADGAVYEGSFVDSIRHGKGTMTWATGAIYTGDWTKGKITGKGYFTYSNGETYEGDFVANAFEGIGTKKYNDGNIYIGEWKANKRHGKGKLMYKEGTVYEGEFSNDFSEGKGTMLYKDGSKYVGDWKGSKYNGKGKYKLINHFEYEGDFVNNLFEGQGTMIWIEGSEYKGDKYIGDFKTGVIGGKGKYIYANGNVYEGDFNSGLFEGSGTMMYKDGGKFIGDFKRGHRTGKGKYIAANGTIEEGEYVDDKFIDPRYKSWTCVTGDCQNGIGTYNFGSDTMITYSGQWKDGKVTGEGVYKNFNTIYKGHLVNRFKDGYGIFINNVGQTYTGNWKDDQLVNGSYSDDKGTSYTGKFRFGGFDLDGETSYRNGNFMGVATKGVWEKGKKNGKWIETNLNGYYKESNFKKDVESNVKYFDNQNRAVSKEEYDAKNPYQVCTGGNCFNGVGICEYEHGKNIFVGYWKDWKKEGFVASFNISGDIYYGIWSADTLVKKIDDKEAEKYLTANPKAFRTLLNSNTRFAAAASLIENCTTTTCSTGDCKNGFGEWADCKGNTYSGYWVDGNWSGQGKFKANNGNLYEGSFKNGVLEGKGKYEWINGAVYDGDWINNIRQGKGRQRYDNGDIYEGDWVNGTRQGKGEMTWQKQEYYKGDWVSDVRQGKGRSLDKDGRIREGDWINDKFVITEAQREINDDAKYKISVLEQQISDTRMRLINTPAPNDANAKANYDRVRANLEEGINSALKLIDKLTLQIIE